VAQVVEYWITVLKEGGSSPPGVFGDAAAEFAERKFTAVVENVAPGRAPRGVARHGTAPSPSPPSLLLSWRNTRSILLRPILFCIFGMCSPRRKSAATVRTVQRERSLYPECLSCLPAEISSPTFHLRDLLSPPCTESLSCRNASFLDISFHYFQPESPFACSFRRYEKLSSIYGVSKGCVPPANLQSLSTHVNYKGRHNPSCQLSLLKTRYPRGEP